MGGKGLRPNNSIGAIPLNSAKLSSTNWTKRERFATTRTVSSSNLRTKARTFGFSGERNSMLPRPKAWKRLRSARSRFIHQSSELGLACCDSTFNDS